MKNTTELDTSLLTTSTSATLTPPASAPITQEAVTSLPVSTLSESWDALLFDFFDHLTLLDISVISVNLLLIIFAQPILKRLSSNAVSDQIFTLRFNLLRGLNLIILTAYGYQAIYQPNDAHGPAIKAMSIAAILYLTYICNYFLQFLINKHYGRSREIGEQTLYIQTYQSRLLSIIAAVLLTVISLVGIIRILGFESMLEAGGVLGIIGVFLALTQASWAPDIISGLIILNSDMFEEGDIIEFEGVFGRVYRTKLFHTEIINIRNNHRIMLRNAIMRDKTVHNLSKFATGTGLRECLKFNIGYDVDIEKVKTMLNTAFEHAVEKKLPLEPNTPAQIKVLDTGDHAITYGFLFHIKKVEQLVTVRRELREIILNESKLHSISLATPTTHFVSMNN